MTVTLSFHGAAGTVTGSCYRITHDGGAFLVDCGLFQGNRTVRALNDKPFPFSPKATDFVLLTHAHIDHVGLVPKLYKSGYRGPLHATAATHGLIEFLLPDSASIQESEIERKNRRLSQRGEPPMEPLYALRDAELALEHRTEHEYCEWFTPGEGVRARFWNAGHILGSTSIELEIAQAGGRPVRILFSGDIGPDEKAFYLSPDSPHDLDYVVCESTYGGRERADYTLEARRRALGQELSEALGKGGNVIIPAFAVERSQELLHDIGVLIKDGIVNPLAVFLDSPLARRVTGVFRSFAHQFEDTELSAEELFSDPRFKIVQTVEESKAINLIRGGAIIISASGMCDAGRVKHHLRNNLSRHNATVLFVGYQAKGTLGHVIQGGADMVRIHGRETVVRASIRTIQNYSAHADHSELVAWIKARLPINGSVFLTHGDDEEREAFAAALRDLGLSSDQIIRPELDDMVELLSGGSGAAVRTKTRRIDPSQITHDWHNSYAEFIIELSHALRAAPDDRERQAIMDRVKAALI